MLKHNDNMSAFSFDMSGIQTPDSSPDILLISAPLTVTNVPFMAGAALKPIAVKAGYSCSTIDLNRLTLQWVQSKQLRDRYTDITNFFFAYGTVDNCKNEIDQWISTVVSAIEKINPKILGISVFTDYSRSATRLIAEQVKKQCPHIKILLGGHGISKGQKYGVLDAISFGEKLRQDGIVDHYIQGDAEHSFYEFLKNNLDFPGIDNSSWQQLDNASMSELPYPDYSDYNWNLYPERAIGITGSRGCVRECTFCDYIVFHKKFTWRSADNIFEEMLQQKNNHNISYFQFSDSLINGNMKEFRKLIELLADYNNQHPDDKLYWDSYFILRPKVQFKEELWKLVADSGCKSIFIGVETFSDRVRAHMDKGFNNEDLEFGLEMAAKYNVPLLLMLIVGYVTETDEDFEQNLTWLTQHQHYKNTFNLYVANTMVLLPDSWLDQHKDNLKITIADTENRESWTNHEIGNTLDVRLQRRSRLLQHARDLNYTVIDEFNLHAILENILIN